MKNVLLGIYGSDFFHGDTFNGLIIYSFGYSAKGFLYFYSNIFWWARIETSNLVVKCRFFWVSFNRT